MSIRDDGKDAERSMEETRSSRQCGMDIYEPSLLLCMYMDMRMPEAYIKIFRSILVAEHTSSRRKIWNGGQTTKLLYCISFTFSS